MSPGTATSHCLRPRRQRRRSRKRSPERAPRLVEPIERARARQSPGPVSFARMTQPTPVPAELSRWRADTPGSAERIHLNNAGAALPPRPVLDAVVSHLRRESEIGGYEAADAA